jgi:lipoyl(octanoyl) transferase
MQVRRLGLIDYREALAMQTAERERVWAGESEGTLFLLEHPPVYTLGRRSQPGDLPMGEDWYRAQGIDVLRTDRGGKLTYHGPGQLVGYPVVRVERIPDYVCGLEQAIVAALAQEGIEARGRDCEGPQYTGVWVGDRKIASIGIHVSRGVAIHGFAVNVDNDLQPFEWAVACGMPDTRMTSVCRETGRSGTFDAIADRIAAELRVPSNV